MNSYENQYLELCKSVLENGDFVGDRTGTGCYSVFGGMMKIDLTEGFPILTTKKVNLGNIVGELLFFLSGCTDLHALRHYQDKEDNSHTIWSDDFEKFINHRPELKFIYKDLQDLGNIYGHQWRSFQCIDMFGDDCAHDQIRELIKHIIAVKNGDMTMARRLIVTAWHPYDHTVGDKVVAALPACHDSFQCIVRDGKLSLRFHCRSNDIFLGNPYNISSYALLCHILAKLTGLEVGELLYFGTDIHLYSNHVDQMKEQLSRKPKKLPILILPEFENLEDLLQLTAKDFKLEGYDPHPFIKAPQAS